MGKRTVNKNGDGFPILRAAIFNLMKALDALNISANTSQFLVASLIQMDAKSVDTTPPTSS